MISKRLTAIIRPSAGPGINAKGLPTINVCGSEVSLELYFRILDALNEGLSEDVIVAAIVSSLTEVRDSSTNYSTVIEIIRTNYKLAHGADPVPDPANRSKNVANHAKPRTISTLRPKRVTTHVSYSDPGLPSPVSPEKEEQQLIADALRLASERDAVNSSITDSLAIRRATAAIDLQLRSSLRRHKELDDAQDDAAILRSLHEQNLS